MTAGRSYSLCRLARWVFRTRSGDRRRARLWVQPLEDRVVPAVEPTFRGGLTVAAADLTFDGRP